AARTLRVVGVDPAGRAIDGDGAAVRKDPLRSGVPERDTDADDRLRVVATHHVDDHLPLLGAEPGPLVGGWTPGVIGDRRPGDQDRAYFLEKAAFAEYADDPADVARRQQFFRGLQQEYATAQDLRWEREPVRGQDPLDHLEAATPGATGHRPGRPVPRPRLGGLPLPEGLQCPRIRPVDAEVLRLTGIGDLQLFTGQQCGA